MSNNQLSLLVKRERETEQWLKSKDWSEIVMRIHELEDQVESLEAELGLMKEKDYVD